MRQWLTQYIRASSNQYNSFLLKTNNNKIHFKVVCIRRRGRFLSQNAIRNTMKSISAMFTSPMAQLILTIGDTWMGLNGDHESYKTSTINMAHDVIAAVYMSATATMTS
jgi:hypothetical protein